MEIQIQIHYLSPFRGEIEVPAQAISAYYKAAHASLNLQFAHPLQHSRADGQSADFFDAPGSRRDYCRHIARTLRAAPDTKVPTIHLLISAGRPQLFDSHPDGAILNNDRTAVAVFLGSRNFTNTYKNRPPRYADLWDIFYLQVCIHEIGHALTWTHGIEAQSVIRHIMLQSKHRVVDAYKGPWDKASYAQPKYNRLPIKCHPLPDPAIEGLNRPESVWLPGQGLPFSEETLCS